MIFISIQLPRCAICAISIGAILTAYSPKTADAEFIKPSNVTLVSMPVQCIPKLENIEMEPVSTDKSPDVVFVGTCTITYYCPCIQCNGNPDKIARDGTNLVPYVTCAVDPEIIPLGSEVRIDFGGGDVQYFRACDTGSAIQKNHIDICVRTHEEALKLGVKTAEVAYRKTESE